jgi:APA family basic amino acid/polyamine antiporter
MIVALDYTTLKVAAMWMILGIIIYYAYSKNHSKIRNSEK